MWYENEIVFEEKTYYVLAKVQHSGLYEELAYLECYDEEDNDVSPEMENDEDFINYILELSAS